MMRSKPTDLAGMLGSAALTDRKKVLRGHLGVTEAAVTATLSESHETRLVAYLTCPMISAPRLTELRRFLQEHLPDYMIPSGFVRLESIPLTPNGKIDRMALSEAEAIRLELDTPYVRPQSEIERKLAQIWEEVLGVRAIGMYDNFFDLGGHSLLATQMNAKLTSEFRVELPLRTLFDKPTVEDQAIAIARMQAESAGRDLWSAS